MDLLIYLPNDPPRPLPVFLMLNFTGNHTFYDDPAIRLRVRPVQVFNTLDEKDFFSSERPRGWRDLPKLVDKTLERGYGFATICYNDIILTSTTVSGTVFTAYGLRQSSWQRKPRTRFTGYWVRIGCRWKRCAFKPSCNGDNWLSCSLWWTRLNPI